MVTEIGSKKKFVKLERTDRSARIVNEKMSKTILLV
jgi:hypothetical protein